MVRPAVLHTSTKQIPRWSDPLLSLYHYTGGRGWLYINLGLQTWAWSQVALLFSVSFEAVYHNRGGSMLLVTRKLHLLIGRHCIQHVQILGTEGTAQVRPTC